MYASLSSNGRPSCSDSAGFSSKGSLSSRSLVTPELSTSSGISAGSLQLLHSRAVKNDNLPLAKRVALRRSEASCFGTAAAYAEKRKEAGEACGRQDNIDESR